jgi:hypothetical protein
MLEIKEPFIGYTTFIINIISKMFNALQDGTTPIFLSVGGINPDNTGRGPATLKLINSEDLQKYEGKDKEYTTIIKSFISDSKGDLEDYRYNFVAYLTSLTNLDLSKKQHTDHLTEEMKEALEYDEEINIETKTNIDEQPDDNQMEIQIYFKEKNVDENVWLTTIPIDHKKENEGISFQFHWESLETKDIGLTKSEVLDTLVGEGL